MLVQLALQRKGLLLTVNVRLTRSILRNVSDVVEAT